jgi:hypothetical protein
VLQGAGFACAIENGEQLIIANLLGNFVSSLDRARSSHSISEIECCASRAVDELDERCEGGELEQSGIIDAFSAQNFISLNLLIPSKANCFACRKYFVEL